MLRPFIKVCNPNEGLDHQDGMLLNLHKQRDGRRSSNFGVNDGRSGRALGSHQAFTHSMMRGSEVLCKESMPAPIKASVVLFKVHSLSPKFFPFCPTLAEGADRLLDLS